jgi:hypothetical protein
MEMQVSRISGLSVDMSDQFKHGFAEWCVDRSATVCRENNAAVTAVAKAVTAEAVATLRSALVDSAVELPAPLGKIQQALNILLENVAADALSELERLDDCSTGSLTTAALDALKAELAVRLEIVTVQNRTSFKEACSAVVECICAQHTAAVAEASGGATQPVEQRQLRASLEKHLRAVEEEAKTAFPDAGEDAEMVLFLSKSKQQLHEACSRVNETVIQRNNSQVRCSYTRNHSKCLLIMLLLFGV